MAEAEAIPFGHRLADTVASAVGSWRFVLIQSTLLWIWVTANLLGFFPHWDEPPFILLNLLLSFSAAYTAPIIMMSQNRQAARDRAILQGIYDLAQREELELEQLEQEIGGHAT